jgi:phosphoribosylanthranilate isomerase
MYLNGIQLNGVFGTITPEVLAGIRAKYPRLEIILQIHQKALDSMLVKEIIAKLKDFDELVDCVLIDPSGGRGEEMDVAHAGILGNLILNHTLISVGFAGGLKGDNVGRIVGELRRRLGTSNFSIDAEGGLRDRVGEGYGNDKFNAVKAYKYFQNATEAFAS